MRIPFLLLAMASAVTASAVTVEVADGETSPVQVAAENLRKDLDRACPGHMDDGRKIVVRTVADGKWEASKRTYENGVWTVIGSTPRGTVYGIYAISERLGVSPFHWMDDIPVVPRKFDLSEEPFEISEPAVKYRGIFINDEDLCLRKWAQTNFERKGKYSIGAKTYDMIFEMMLRARLNYIWPAMHDGGYEFVSKAENVALAEKVGIVLGTSHCEPMLRNNIYLSKDDKKKWNFVDNPDFLTNYWSYCVRKYPDVEAVWTIGMRGIHDGAMPGKDRAEKIRTVEAVFAAQEYLLKGVKPAATLFVPYKEVLELFNAGLKVPSGTTIMWPNDNYGYIRRLGGPATANYPGGIYWHVSYCGRPHSYMHLCTTAPGFMWWELGAKCANNNTREMWMVNAGDVKPADVLVFSLGRIAWAPEKYGPNAQNVILREWADEFLGVKDGKLANDIVSHMEKYYEIFTMRKPEFMCLPWIDAIPADMKKSLLVQYESLLAEDEVIEARLPETHRDAWFDAFGYQARFSCEAGRLFMRWNEEEAEALRKETDSRIGALTRRYDSIFGGKWKGFWFDTVNASFSNRQGTSTGNRWSSQMQWPWHEPKGGRVLDNKQNFTATSGGLDIPFKAPEGTWKKAVDFDDAKGANGGNWTVVDGICGKSLALYPCKPDCGRGATAEYSIKAVKCDSRLTVRVLPDFALWPGMRLRFGVSVNDGEVKTVEVPFSNSNINERCPQRHAAVQDAFIDVVADGVKVREGVNKVRIVAVDPGVVIESLGFVSK